MRASSIVLALGFALFANAQTTTGNSEPTTTQDAAEAAQSSAQAEMLRCLEACDAGDVNCTSKCIAVPSPNESQVNATTTCVANCDQGDGSEAATNAYSDCVQACIGANYFTSSIGTPQPTGAAGNSGSNNNGDNNNDSDDNNSDNNNEGGNNDGATGTSGNQQTSTEDAATSTSTGAAAAVTGMAAGGVVGMVGFMAAVMAL